ncbi:MAG TPA: hypothetical protein VFS05_07695 [Gemmatimonadaceae bacterium]|nr:hypothetical protein [Gemmatimonadaceae bacterium]
MMLSSRIALALTLAGAMAAATPAAAQKGRGPAKVPPGHMPPAGMCRVWIDGVPPGRQPAPTDCATARRRAPRNSVILYGDRRYDRDDRYGRDDRYDRDDRRDRDRRNDRDRRDYCVDANGDGRCDYAQARQSRRLPDRFCADRDHDGWCDWREARRDRRDDGRVIDRDDRNGDLPWWERLRIEQERRKREEAARRSGSTGTIWDR